MSETLQSRPEDIHVMPTFGKPHESSSVCWCQPKVDPATLDERIYCKRVWIHEPTN